MSAEGRWRRAAAAAVALGAVLTAVLLLRPAAREPGRLVGEVPADGARLAAAPADVELTFSAPVDPARVHLAVRDAAGRSSAGAPHVDGRVVRVQVRPAGDGTYQVGYHVVLRRGEEITGVTAFTVGAGDPAATGEADVAHDHLGSGPATVAALAVGGVLALLVLPLLFRRRVR